MVSLRERFAASFEELAGTAVGVAELLPSRLAIAGTRVLDGVNAIGVSLFGERLRVPIGTSSTAATVAQQLQFTFGEGPCFKAFQTATSVWADEAELARSWPIFAAQLDARTPFRSIASLPLTGGLSGLGTVDLYYRSNDDMSLEAPADVAGVIHQISTYLARSTPTRRSWVREEPPWIDGPITSARFIVPIAVGMLIQHNGLSFQDGLACLRARAFAEDRTVDELARDLVNRNATVESMEDS